MGIFGVSIAIAYGEGGRPAFSRLLHEILNSERYGTLDLLNWAGQGESRSSCILPLSPRQYLRRSSSIKLPYARLFEPLALSNMGARISLLLLPGRLIAADTHPKQKPKGHYSAVVTITEAGEDFTDAYHLLDAGGLDGTEIGSVKTELGSNNTYSQCSISSGVEKVSIFHKLVLQWHCDASKTLAKSQVLGIAAASTQQNLLYSSCRKRTMLPRIS
ncbi:hypothetical protein BDN70DRAFT_875521 [Pholiota conissans]|uniref:Uncharacterized protein n=1 Tax=Pholiota conissans TaxID=109636 RepID=A0A9P5Z9U0_9AGAR|nr:hypothetical protein BDN70DRAFT_875521 [Pholiota conissans]